MDSKRRADQMMLQMKNSGFDLGEVADIEIPDQAILALLGYLGNTFQCERVYVFEKNKTKGYDCTYEWFCSNTFAKQDMLQNLSEETVRPYYTCFRNEGKIAIRDMDQYMKVNRELATMLKTQALHSLLCGQMVYDEQDIGFVGIDNPAAEKFRELEGIFEIINYYIAIQIHRRKMVNRMEALKPVSGKDDASNQMSLYEKAYSLEIGESAAVVYYDMDKGSPIHQQRSGDLDPESIQYILDVLKSIYGDQNVFHFGHNEFLAVYDHSEEDFVNQYVELSERTLASVGIQASSGIAITDNYNGYFFELVNRANADLLRKNREFRNQYLEKYHMGPKTSSFLDLLEIHPFEDYYHFLYSEHLFLRNREGSFEEGLKEFEAKIHPNERLRFMKFWMDSRQPFRRKDIDENGIARQNFTIMKQDCKSYINIEMSVVQFTDVNGRLVLLCSTR